jgi:N-acetylglutamate synthase-like GNAT family acetyltransferase
MPIELSYLVDYPEFCEQLAVWLHAEWGWFTPGSTLEARRQKLCAHLNRDELPLAVVAHERGTLLGTAALRAQDMDTRRELTPWMASVYVTPSARTLGIGTRLVARIEREAFRLGFGTLYLVTFDKASYYARRGWLSLERTLYRNEPVVVMCKSLSSPAGTMIPLEVPSN